jgi:hypothetical protein
MANTTYNIYFTRRSEQLKCHGNNEHNHITDIFIIKYQYNWNAEYFKFVYNTSRPPKAT